MGYLSLSVLAINQLALAILPTFLVRLKRRLKS